MAKYSSVGAVPRLRIFRQINTARYTSVGGVLGPPVIIAPILENRSIFQDLEKQQ